MNKDRRRRPAALLRIAANDPKEDPGSPIRSLLHTLANRLDFGPSYDARLRHELEDALAKLNRGELVNIWWDIEREVERGRNIIDRFTTKEYRGHRLVLSDDEPGGPRWRVVDLLTGAELGTAPTLEEAEQLVDRKTPGPLRS